MLGDTITERGGRFVALALASVLGLGVLLAATVAHADEASDRAREILEEVDDLYRSGSSYAKMSMEVKTKHYERSMTMEVWTSGKEKSLIRILSPRKEKGTSTLKSGKSIYTYLPKTDRTIRLSSGMMLGSWMGSHFTNDDLVKESRMSEDYDAKVTFEGTRDGVAVIEITLIPKPDAAVVWGKIVSTVRQADKLPMTHVYYDEDMVVARTMVFSKIKEMSGKQLPSVMEVRPADKPDEFTRLIYDELELGVSIKDSKFSINNLKRQ